MLNKTRFTRVEALASSVSQWRACYRSVASSLAQHLKELSARFIDPELDIAFRLLRIAKNASMEGDKETHDKALQRAQKACEWVSRYIDRVPEQDRPPVQAKFEELKATLIKWARPDA